MAATEELIKMETSRAAVYRCLADAFGMPGPELPGNIEKLEAALACLESEGLGAAQRMRLSVDTPEELSVLRIEYARLFAGPFLMLAPPYGSVYLEGNRRIMGDSTLDAQRFYADAGLAVAEQFRDAPDHIAAELEFMHVLIFRETEAIQRGDRSGVLENIGLQKTFLDRHLGAWAPVFADRVQENAETDFYRDLGRLTRLFLTEEMDALIAVTDPPKGPEYDTYTLKETPAV